MKARARLLLGGLAVIVACSGKPPQAEVAAKGDLSHKTVRVVFDLPGDDIGGEGPQRLLRELGDAIQGKSAARVVSSGFGMGTMEIVLAYHGSGSADELGRIIAGVRPQARYRIESRGN